MNWKPPIRRETQWISLSRRPSSPRRAKREQAKAQRKTWDISPVTRKPKNPKAYVREKPRFESDNDDTEAFLLHFSPPPHNGAAYFV